MAKFTRSFVLDALAIVVSFGLAGCGGFGVGGTVDLDINGSHYQISGGSTAKQTAVPTTAPVASSGP